MAQVLDMVIENDKLIVQKVTAAIDCGIVVNHDAAANLAEGGAVDGIGHAMYSGLTFKDGVAEQNNFDKYRLIRHSEAPKEIETHFVQNDIDPTGLGEPPFPPIMGALANALYKATGQRHYLQPFVTKKAVVGQMNGPDSIKLFILNIEYKKEIQYPYSDGFLIRTFLKTLSNFQAYPI